jgi:hypothetical protein
MNWLLPKDAVARYVAKPAPIELVYYNPQEHRKEMREVCTGVAGALLKLADEGIYSVSGPQIGSRIPIVCTLVPRDIIRIFVDPFIEPHGAPVRTGKRYIRKALEHCRLTYFSFKGEPLLMNTCYMRYTNNVGLATELQYQMSILDNCPRTIPCLDPIRPL